MGAKRYHSDKSSNPYVLLMRQKKLIENSLKCFKCGIIHHGLELRCKGTLQPTRDVGEYQILLIQRPELPPDVFIVSPEVKYNPDIHMYSDESLCLYYPPDMPWKSNTSIAEYTIPWINEWIMYYELYKITGIWEGPAVPHKPKKIT